MGIAVNVLICLIIGVVALTGLIKWIKYKIDEHDEFKYLK